MRYPILVTLQVVVILVLVHASCIPLIGADKSAQSVKILRRLPLDGGGRWDYLLVDPDARRLYIARSTRVMVVNTERGD